MKIILISIAMYFLTGIICAGITIAFIEGWPVYLSVSVLFITYFFASLLVCRYFQRLWWLAFFIITLLVWVDLIFGQVDFKFLFYLLKHPGEITERNYYFLLPWALLLFSLSGCFTGFRLATAHRINKGKGNPGTTVPEIV